METVRKVEALASEDPAISSGIATFEIGTVTAVVLADAGARREL